MFKITSHKIAYYPGGNLEPHLQPPDVKYETEKQLVITFDGEDSETGLSYVAVVDATFNSLDGRLETADLNDIYPVNPEQSEAIPQMEADDWVKNHWKHIEEFARY